MLPSLAFVPECLVIHYFNLLMEEFPTFAIEIAEYFEVTHVGRLLPNHTRKTPPFRIWNLYTRVNFEVARTNNSVEGWHNGFNRILVAHIPVSHIATLFTIGTISSKSDVNKVETWRGHDSICYEFSTSQLVHLSSINLSTNSTVHLRIYYFSLQRECLYLRYISHILNCVLPICCSSLIRA